MMNSNSTPKKSLGQHWLHDTTTLNAICDEAELVPSDTVLEVGPGLGTLTSLLCKKAKRVIAVEFDATLAQDLPDRVPDKNLEVVSSDILTFDFNQLPPGYKVVANIPYYLTSHLIRRLLEADNQPSVIVLLIQKEVAERIVAKEGKMSILSVSAQFFADCRLGIEVPAHLFTPPPKVDSQVVILTTHTTPQDVDRKKFFRIVKAGFGEKRKKLANSLAGGLGIDKTIVTGWLSSLHLGENVRAQELAINNWVELYTIIEQQNGVNNGRS